MKASSDVLAILDSSRRRQQAALSCVCAVASSHAATPPASPAVAASIPAKAGINIAKAGSNRAKAASNPALAVFAVSTAGLNLGVVKLVPKVVGFNYSRFGLVPASSRFSPAGSTFCATLSQCSSAQAVSKCAMLSQLSASL